MINLSLYAHGGYRRTPFQTCRHYDIFVDLKSSDMYVKKLPESLEYGVNMTIKVLGGKWKACLLDSIHSGIRRPSDLHRSIPEAPPRVLNQQLKVLEELDIIYKKVYPEVPPKVEYYLTEWGTSLLPVIMQMERWGNNYFEKTTEISLLRK